MDWTTCASAGSTPAQEVGCSVDPVSSEPRYAYAHNQPTLRVDPSGRDAGDWWDIRYWHPITAIEKQIASHFDLLAALEALFTHHLNELFLFATAPERAIKFVQGKAETWYRTEVESVAGTARSMGIDSLIPDILPTPSVFPGVLETKAANRALRQLIPPSVRPLFPPVFFSSDGIAWYGGYLLGFAHALESMVPIGLIANASVSGPLALVTPAIHSLEEAYDVVTDLYKRLVTAKGFTSFITDCLNDAKKSFANVVSNLAQAEPFDKGQVVGVLAADILSILLLLVTVVGAVGAVVRFFEAGGSLAELLAAFRTGGVAEVTKVFRFKSGKVEVLGIDPAEADRLKRLHSSEAQLEAATRTKLLGSGKPVKALPAAPRELPPVPYVRVPYADADYLNLLTNLQRQIPHAHFLDRHGPQTTLAQQYRRAMRGITPDGIQRRPTNSTRWFSYQLEWEAIEEATRRFRAGEHDAKFPNRLSFDFGQMAGEGYLRGGGGGILHSTRRVQAYFHSTDPATARPVTAYPLLDQLPP